jgi:hypothetical protein
MREDCRAEEMAAFVQYTGTGNQMNAVNGIFRKWYSTNMLAPQ